jgi:hypothetical protein
MRTKSLTHKLNILKVLLDTNMRLTASQFNISNANQYLIPLEELKLIKRVEVPRDNCSPFKVGFIDKDTKLKAIEYLSKHNELNTPTPLHIINFSYVEDYAMHGSN